MTRRVRLFESGEVRTLVLSLLSEAPKHGYQLMKELSERSGDQSPTSSGTVYPALKQLEKDRLIEFKTKDGRHVYRLTKNGRKAATAESSTASQIWARLLSSPCVDREQAPVIASPLRELVAAALVAADWGAGNADREDATRAILRDAATKLRRLVAGNK